MKRRILRSWAAAFAVSAASLLGAVLLPAQEAQFVPREDGVYELLGRAQAWGMVEYLPQTRPYTRAQADQLLDEVSRFSADGGPSKETVREIKAAVREYRQRRQEEERGFSLSWGDGSSALVSVRQEAQGAANLSQPGEYRLDYGAVLEVELDINPQLYMGFANLAGMKTQYWTQEDHPPYVPWEKPLHPDYNMFTYNLTQDTSGFDHTGTYPPGDRTVNFVMNQTNQLTGLWGDAVLTVGRQAPSWGPSSRRNTAVSAGAKPFEQVSMNLPIGNRASLSWLTGFLFEYPDGVSYSSIEDKMVAAHRLEFQITPSWQLAFYETAIYGKRFEMPYLNPFNIYYVSEVQAGSPDNKLGGMDILFSAGGNRCYLSLFADDWDLEALFNPFYYHNMMALLAGWENYSLHPGLTLRGEWAYANQWMYTHSNYNYNHYQAPLGLDLPPNSHRLTLEGDYALSGRSSVGLSLELRQEGRDSSPYAKVDWDAEQAAYGVEDLRDLSYTFLDFGVDGGGWTYDTVLSAAVRGRAGFLLWEREMVISGSYRPAWRESRRTGNHSLVEGSRRWDHYLKLGLSWYY